MDGWMQERFRDGRHPWLGGMALGRGLDDGPWMVPCGGASPLGGPPVAARRALAGCKSSGGQVPVGSRPGIGSRAAVDDLHGTHGCPYYLRYARKHATPSAADLRKAHLIIQGSTYPSTPGAARADLTSMTRWLLPRRLRASRSACLPVLCFLESIYPEQQNILLAQNARVMQAASNYLSLIPPHPHASNGRSSATFHSRA